MTITESILIVLDSRQQTSELAFGAAGREMDAAKDCEQVQSGIWTVEEARRFRLADWLKEFYEVTIDDMPLVTWQDAFKSQLCRDAFQEINWHEFADHYLAKVTEKSADETYVRAFDYAARLIDLDEARAYAEHCSGLFDAGESLIDHESCFAKWNSEHSWEG
jgi:hypothetical protein